MGKLSSYFLIVFAAMAASDSWNAVKELSSGVELKIYKTGAKQPLQANLDEASDDKIVVILKNEQVAIAKTDIDRIDWRPKQTGKRVVKESKATSGFETGSATPSAPQKHPGPSTSTSTGLSIGSKPDFKTVYRR